MTTRRILTVILLIGLVTQLVGLSISLSSDTSMTRLDWFTGLVGPSSTVLIIALVQRIKD